MDRVGLGFWEVRGQRQKKTLARSAVEAGYPGIDAAMYYLWEDVRQALACRIAQGSVVCIEDLVLDMWRAAWRHL